MHMKRLMTSTFRILMLLSFAGCGRSPRTFSGQAAYADAQALLAFGPRVSGSEANRLAGDWILERLEEAGWDTFTDEGSYRGVAVRNLAAKLGRGPIVILGAHYDSRRCADQPDGECEEAVLGANDGVSGVVVLLELARSLDLDWSENQVWLVFFDAEDNGRLDGWDWIIGSRQFARLVKSGMDDGSVFRGMVLLDMVGDADQQFPYEGNSDPAVRESIWSAAKELGYEEAFPARMGPTMLDDHIPFRDLGVPAVDIIDFDYPYWHTAHDTLDKISPLSLERVGRTVEAWLEQNGGR
jgi:glutaminyl-peptide cyclotransferase